MTNDALKALDDVFLTMCPTFSMNTGQETQQGRITLDQYLKIRAALAPVDVEGLKKPVNDGVFIRCAQNFNMGYNQAIDDLKSRLVADIKKEIE